MSNRISLLYVSLILLFAQSCFSPKPPIFQPTHSQTLPLQTSNSQTQTPNLKPQTPNPKLTNSNSKPQTPNSKTLKIRRISTPYPSASAGIITQNQWWIIGDDAQKMLVSPLNLDTPYTYKNLPFQRELKTANTPINSNHNRFKKKYKLDFEALAQYQDPNNLNHIWAFGSGSKSPYRDTGLYWNFENTQAPTEPFKINLSPLYEVLQRRSQISPEKWNIEGACIDPSQEGALYLLNRLPATLIRIPLRDWFRYLEIGSVPPDENIQIKTYTLPQIQGHPSGFSGATYDSMRHSIWFSSSVEITDDPIRDGEILGSFIGEIFLLSGEINRTPMPVPEDPGVTPKTKLESLSIGPESNAEKRLFYGTVDNDNGGSQLLLIQIVFD